MLIVTLTRILKTSMVSLWRNRWLSLGATLIMILTLFTISFFSSLLLVVNRANTVLNDKVDISVYFNESASKDQIFSIQNTLLSRSDIKTVNYVSKEKALERWKSLNQDNERLRDLVTATANPLPRSLEIKTDKPEDLEKINQFLSSKDYEPLVKEISYRKNKDLVDRLVKITNFIKYTGWILSIVFVLVSILIIYNTIRLTIYARSNEIEIMKLVGASDWYVQGPFLIEGLSYGILGSIVSSFVLYLAFKLSMPAAETYLGLSGPNSLYSSLNFGLIAGIQLVIGLFLGMFCSVFAVKKHLK